MKNTKFRKLIPALVDFLSAAGALAALYLTDASAWAYLALLAFGMAQQYVGLCKGPEDAMKRGMQRLFAAITKTHPDPNP